MIIHAEVYFKDSSSIIQLMKDQSSCARSAYQAIHKFGLKTRKDIYAHLKKNFATKLKAIQIYDAIDLVKGIENPGAIFGGKKIWNKFLTGKISKNKWLELRNGQYYASGDKRLKGNRSVRIIGDRVLVSSPTGFREWIEGKIFIPKKWKNIKLTCYNIRLKLRDGKFSLIISQPVSPPSLLSMNSGAIGVDTNPDGLGISEINNTGNLIFHSYMKSQRIQFASNNKRMHDIRILAKSVVDFAIRQNKPIVLEQLNFKNKKSYSKKFNRMRHNFVYRKIIEAIHTRATKFGISIIEVNPAFTSILGILKYQKMLSLNRHTSAALVIARRGLGFKERQNFNVSSKETKKTVRPSLKSGIFHTLEGRGKSITLSDKAWSWLQDSFLKPKPVTLTGSGPEPGSIPGIEPSSGEIPEGESWRITGNPGQFKLNCRVGSDS